MTNIPTNYDTNALTARIEIYDYDGVLQYEYDAIPGGTGTKDFQLTDLTIKNAGDGEYGHATMIIADHDKALVDTTEKRRRCLIERQWEIRIFLGKTDAKKYQQFWGKILDADIIRAGTNENHVALTCIGWGSILKERLTKIRRNQEKLADGISLDPADTSTRLDNLILALFTDKETQMDEDIPLLTSITAAVAEDGLCAECLDINLANVNELGNTFAGFIARMAGVANTRWHVDPDRKLIIRDPSSHGSGMLFTNDLGTLTTNQWAEGKIGFIQNAPISWKDSSFETLIPFIHGYGHFAPVKDVVQETAPNASENLDDEWVSFEFTPEQDNIFKIAVRAIKTGTPIGPAEIQIRGDDGAGMPDAKDIRRTIRIGTETLQGLDTSVPADWFEIPVRPRLDITPNEKLHIVFRQFGTGSDTYNVNYTTGSGTYHTSSDGVSWSPVTGDMAYRIYSAKRVTTTVENVSLVKKLIEPREKLFPVRSDLEQDTVREALIQACELLGMERRTYNDIIITPPDDRIPLGAFCRVIDKETGLDVKAHILSYEIEMHSKDPSRIGADEITLTLDDIHAIP
jgi:hypothetical protein